ncbi:MULTISPECIES: hypothetical protein [unclassified Cyanobium]|uniref:hypothetical protein n=1 Tax=unclassified Cyanobium TaxID=2627006 RepID=UPI0020CDF9DD|nr:MULTISPECIES: hypothetical protein [unclassified Cyanobium]MCP9778145.1 hypothetical protein [Cyanobium sp. Tous-M-B4]MCP9876541.1 hypothetical protein [Cyanobium sp. A2C-AMD]
MKQLLPLAFTIQSLLLAMLPAAAQVTVGYSNPIFTSAFVGVEERRGVRETVQFGVAGVNVVPADGSLIYDENTIWKIDQPDRPFSLTVVENSPQLEIRNSDVITRSAQVGRTERVYVQVSGPAAESLRSVFLDGLTLPDGPALPSTSISVFAP